MKIKLNDSDYEHMGHAIDVDEVTITLDDGRQIVIKEKAPGKIELLGKKGSFVHHTDISSLFA